VILAGAAAVAWVNWYFFMAGRAPSAQDREKRADEGYDHAQ
jgi:hypothetical protein